MSVFRIFKSSGAVKLYITFILFCVSGIVCDRVLLPFYTNLGGVVIVPDVVGLDKRQAFDLLKSAKLDPIEAGTRFDYQYPEGTVTFQSPLSNMNVRKNRRIYLTISSGEEFFIVPNLIGKNINDAKIILLNAGLRLGTITYDINNNSGLDLITRQHIAANSKAKPESAINVTVPKQQSEGNLIVPLLTNKSLNEAEKILAHAKMTIGKIIYVYRDDLIPNTVVDQFPRAGDLVEEGREIHLWVVEESRSPLYHSED
jgi:serine/threonine-protein kinase